ncbi:MAG: site-2 protease family protein [Synechococcaceae cyanobacterium SM2_3_2]|nr:site-2 protease family protein [Synechococcaceae cyanobacterium SM2_3_2]
MDITLQLISIFTLAALSLLGWGFFRARQRGKAAMLMWIQGSLLVMPWLVFLGLLAFGIYLNVAGFLALLIGFTAIYIAVGRRVRSMVAQMPPTPPEANPGGNDESEDPLSAGKPAPETDLTPRMASADIDAIQGIFGIDTFFATEAIAYGEGVIFKGNLRGDPEVILAQLQPKLAEIVGARYQLYLVEDVREKPAMVVLPTEAVNQRASTGAKVLAGILFALSGLSTLEVGANLLGFRLLENWQGWPLALPFSVGILGILLLHESGHRWMAGRYGVRLSPAFVVPSFGIGTLGSLNRIESPVPTRKALFDIAFAGPAVGGAVSLAVLLLGLFLSGGEGDLLVPTTLLTNSVLVASLTRLIVGAGVGAEVVGIHPLVAMGWISLGVTALSLLPAGQLDGGRMVQAVYGRKLAGRATFVSLILLGVAALSNVLALYWALLILFIAREPERPPQNELTPTDDLRDGLTLVALFLVATILLPVPPALAGILHLGG